MKHEAQHSDAENAKGPLSVSRPGDDLKSSSRGTAESIAREDERGQQHITGKGGDAVTANVQGGQP